MAGAFINPHGVVARANGSLFYGTRVPDLHLLRYNRYADATGTHRLRGPKTWRATERSSPARIRWIWVPIES